MSVYRLLPRISGKTDIPSETDASICDYLYFVIIGGDQSDRFIVQKPEI